MTVSDRNIYVDLLWDIITKDFIEVLRIESENIKELKLIGYNFLI